MVALKDSLASIKYNHNFMRPLITFALLICCLQSHGQSTLFELASPFEPFNLSDFKGRIIDFNNDGLEDVWGSQTTMPNSTKIWLANDDGSFSPLDVFSTHFDNVEFQEPSFNVDMNKDGWVDLILASWPEGENGEFRTYTVFLNQEGIGMAKASSFSTADLLSMVGAESMFAVPRHLIDLNADGHPDWVVTDRTNRDVWIFESDPDFPCEIGQSASSLLYHYDAERINYSFVDLDDDHDLDFVASEGTNQYSLHVTSSQLNDGFGGFTSAELTGFSEGRSNGFVGTGDLNGDRKIDMFCGQADCCISEGMYLYESQDEFYDFLSTPNAFSILDDPYISNGITVDLDLDGHVDVFWSSVTALQSMRIQCHQGQSDGTLTNVSEEWNLYWGVTGGFISGYSAGIGREVGGVVMDWNLDSKPDVAINGRNFPALAVNNPTDANWQLINNSENRGLRVSLRACTGMTCGLGARVSAKYDARWHDGWVDCQALRSGGTSFLTFGSSSAQFVDSLVVNWVGGAQTIMLNVAFDQTIVIQESQDCFEANGGCNDELACNFDPTATCNDGSCDYSCCPGPGCCGSGTIWNAVSQTCVIDSTDITCNLSCGEGTIWDETTQTCVLENSDCDFVYDGTNDGVVGAGDLLGLLTEFGSECNSTSTFNCGDPLSYNGYDYETVQIGEQCWFAENLRTTKFANGDQIPHLPNSENWLNADSVETGALCNFNNDTLIGWSFGKLYNWYVVSDQRGICPTTWHVPTTAEWNQLTDAIGDSAAVELKGNYSETWLGSGTEGFNAIPGGFRDWGNAVFFAEGTRGNWWTSSDQGGAGFWRGMYDNSNEVSGALFNKRMGNSIRCIKDSE